MKAYRAEHAPRAADEAAWYRRPGLRLTDVVNLAARCQRPKPGQPEIAEKHDHQWRIRWVTLNTAERRLQAIRNSLAASRTFDILHDRICAATADIAGLGPLARYDIAQRIGAFLGLEPERVYLHRGTLDGAKALGLPTKGGTLEVGDLPAELRRLPASAVEDILCIFKRDLGRFRGAQASA